MALNVRLQKMNKEEAKIILSELLSEYRGQSYKTLCRLLDAQDISETTSESGAKYQVEFQANWDDKDNGNLRVIGSIDGGGLQSFIPITEDFIISPNGEFLGE